jgi:hypothetical protein
MEEVKGIEQLKVVTFGGYQLGCFIDTINDEKKAIEILREHKLPGGIIINKMKSSSKIINGAFRLHFIAVDNLVNPAFLCEILTEQGRKNGVYFKTKSIHRFPDKVYAANLNLLT